MIWQYNRSSICSLWQVGDFCQIKRLPSLSWRLSAVWWLNLWQLDPWLDPYCALTGEAYIRLNKLTEAEHWYRESLRAKPDHIPAHLTYGKLLAMTVWLPLSLPFICKLISWEIKPTSYHSICKWSLEKKGLVSDTFSCSRSVLGTVKCFHALYHGCISRFRSWS